MSEFRIEVDMGHGGYGFLDDLDALLYDVKREFGNEVRNEVKEWAMKSKKGDKFKKDFGDYTHLYITNVGR